jgi:hypothetical protein
MSSSTFTLDASRPSLKTYRDLDRQLYATPTFPTRTTYKAAFVDLQAAPCGHSLAATTMLIVSANEDSSALEMPKFSPVRFHEASAKCTESMLGTVLVARSRSEYASASGTTTLICRVSKEYDRRGRKEYWFTFHKYHAAALERHGKGYVALACGSPTAVLLIPYREFAAWLQGSTLKRLEDGRLYRHIRIHKVAGAFLMFQGSGKEWADVTAYLVPVAGGDILGTS